VGLVGGIAANQAHTNSKHHKGLVIPIPPEAGEGI